MVPPARAGAGGAARDPARRRRDRRTVRGAVAAEVSALSGVATPVIALDDGADGSVNRTLDRLVRTRFTVGRRRLPAFTTCGFAGLALAWVLALALVARRGLPLWPMAV